VRCYLLPLTRSRLSRHLLLRAASSRITHRCHQRALRRSFTSTVHCLLTSHLEHMPRSLHYTVRALMPFFFILRAYYLFSCAPCYKPLFLPCCISAHSWDALAFCALSHARSFARVGAWLHSTHLPVSLHLAALSRALPRDMPHTVRYVRDHLLFICGGGRCTHRICGGCRSALSFSAHSFAACHAAHRSRTRWRSPLSPHALPRIKSLARAALARALLLRLLFLACARQHSNAFSCAPDAAFAWRIHQRSRCHRAHGVSCSKLGAFLAAVCGMSFELALDSTNGGAHRSFNSTRARRRCSANVAQSFKHHRRCDTLASCGAFFTCCMFILLIAHCSCGRDARCISASAPLSRRAAHHTALLPVLVETCLSLKPALFWRSLNALSSLSIAWRRLQCVISLSCRQRASRVQNVVTARTHRLGGIARQTLGGGDMFGIDNSLL